MKHEQILHNGISLYLFILISCISLSCTTGLVCLIILARYQLFILSLLFYVFLHLCDFVQAPPPPLASTLLFQLVYMEYSCSVFRSVHALYSSFTPLGRNKSFSCVFFKCEHTLMMAPS